MTGTLNPPIPVIGQLNSIEDPIVKESLEKIRDGLNAILASDNTVDPALFNTANKIKFKWYEPKIINTEEARENAAFGFLTTEDKIPNVVVNENALIYLNYSALWKSSVNFAGKAAIFLGNEQAKGISGAGQESSTPAAGAFSKTYAGTEGLVQGGNTSFVSTGEITQSGGYTVIQRLTPGTYTIGIKYRATSGNVTAKERLLQICTLG